jgi:NAD(P)-dependent dehydrogenase (short-subunit alcohol dehydrogenase family)
MDLLSGFRRGYCRMPTVLITGANRGIGLALAQQYAADGWKVIATARDKAKASELSRLPGVRVESLEVADDEAISALARTLQGEAIDVLFNNAGIAGREAATLGSIDSAVWAETLRVNVIAPIKVAEAFAEHVAASRQKKMAFVSSQLGSIEWNTTGGRYSYNSSKAALNMAARSLSVDLRPRGIAVGLLHPGHVRTDMGGASAPVLPDDSAAGMRKVVDGLTLARTGGFFNYDGSSIPW